MSSLTIPVTATVGGLGILKLIIHSLRGTSSIKEPPPPTECFGQYCIKAESKLARKNKNKNKNKDVKRQDTVYKIYKGYDKNMEIIGKVENMCKKYTISFYYYEKNTQKEDLQKNPKSNFSKKLNKKAVKDPIVKKAIDIFKGEVIEIKTLENNWL